MNTTITLDDLKKLFSNNDINSYHISVSTNFIDNCIWFFEFDEYISFLKENNVKNVFLNEEFYEKDDYIITNEIVEWEMRHKSGFLPEFIEIIEKYNKELLSADFNIPHHIFAISTINNLNFLFMFSNEDYYEKMNIKEPKEKLNDIYVKFSAEIENKKTFETDEKAKLEKQLLEYLSKNSDFLICTNKEMRKRFLKEFIQKNQTGSFALLVKYWSPYGTGSYNKEALNYIEYAWRIIKSK